MCFPLNFRKVDKRVSIAFVLFFEVGIDRLNDFFAEFNWFSWQGASPFTVEKGFWFIIR